MSLTPADIGQLADHGLPLAEAERQLDQLRHGQDWIRLVRPCTVGDGIRQLPGEQHKALAMRFSAASAAGQVIRFVPASGAATRMFQPLHGNSQDGELPRFLDELRHFPFVSDLAAELSRKGHDLPAVCQAGNLPLLLAVLLEEHGLGYAHRPKGLLPFHRDEEGIRTAFVEHLAETAQLVGPGNLARLHFTVSPEHRFLFTDHLASRQRGLEQRYGVSFEIGFSIQDPATDTLALGPDGEPLRDADGRLVLRPGGHGALLDNLAALAGDVVLVRNIDNVVPDRRKADNLHWDQLLGGLLLELVDVQRTLLNLLHRSPEDPELRRWAGAFLRGDLDLCLPVPLPDTALLVSLLDRPLRVCGMVANSGEPGGGPFWVYDRERQASRQIVEASQINRADPEQSKIFAASTHFNPVIMACNTINGNGQPYELSRFVDQRAAIVTSKVQNGQPIRILERPGLWNGGMSGWHTLFVELPASTFNPVKTVFDLLRPAHQP